MVEPFFSHEKLKQWSNNQDVKESEILLLLGGKVESLHPPGSSCCLSNLLGSKKNFNLPQKRR